MGLVLNLIALGAAAQDDEAQIQSAIRRLGDDSAQVREEAERELMSIGEKARAAITGIIDSSSDEEVKQRCRKILAGLEIVRILGARESGNFFRAETWRGRLDALKCPPEVNIDPKELQLVADEILSRVDEDDRWQLVEAIGREKVRRASGVLLKLARAEEPQDRCRAARACGYFGAREFIPVLEKLFKEDEVYYVRQCAALGLADIEPEQRVATMARLLKDSAPENRLFAAERLAELEARNLAPEILGLLDEKDDFIRGRAAEVFRKLGATENIADRLVSRLDDPSPTVRIHLMWALIPHQPQIRTSVLRKLLGDEDAGVRGEAIQAVGLQRVRELLPEILDVLVEGRDYPYLRAEAVEVIRVLQVKEEIPRLAGLLRDPDSGIRLNAVHALGWLGARDRVPEIVDMLRDGDRGVRFYAVGALENLRATEAIPAVAELLAHGEVGVQISAIQALAKLGATESAPKIVALMAEQDGEIRSEAAEALVLMGARAVWPQVGKLLGHDEPEVRATAVGTLASLGAREALPEILKLLGDKDESVRGGALLALGTFGAADAVSELTRFLKDPNPSLRGCAAWALGEIGKRESVPEVARLLEDPDEEAIVSAAVALGKLDARESIPALKKILENVSGGNRRDVLNSMRRLGEKTIDESILASEFDTGISLNALRAPEAWRRLTQTRVKDDLEGNPTDVLKRLAEEAGLAFSPECARENRWIWVPRGITLLSALERATRESTYICGYILDSGSLRVLTVDRARKNWRAWWAEENKKGRAQE